MEWVVIAAVLASSILVAVADAVIKKMSTHASVWQAIQNPLVLVVAALYLLQIAALVYVYSQGGLLGIVGSLQLILVTILVVGIGAVFYGERLSGVQLAGIVIGLVGAVMLNWPS
ncbi:Uncharacterised protein [uncultured archaeon]|nr:Uncharacterised protein [uncultured archaeon]